MAKKSTFTAADYISQRDALEQQIQEAEENHRRAGYRQVLGEGSQDDVDKALVTLGALKNRRRSLAAAWEETQRRTAAAGQNAKKADQASALENMTGLLERRAGLAEKVEKAVRELGALVTEYTEAGSQVRLIAARLYTGHAAKLPGGRNSLEFIQSEIDSGRDVRLISGLLHKVGVDLTSTRPINDRYEYDETGGLAPHVEKTNSRIRFRAAELCPDLSGNEDVAA